MRHPDGRQHAYCHERSRAGAQVTQTSLQACSHTTNRHNRDLKPQNIFLDAPHPTPQIGDFEWSFLTSPSDLRNPDAWAGELTPGFCPPEGVLYVDYTDMKPIDRAQMLEKYNVYVPPPIRVLLLMDCTDSAYSWQVGAILRCMILREQAPPQALWLGDGSKDETYKLRLVDENGGKVDKYGVEEQYSEELLDMVERCMCYDVEDRPTFKELLEEILELTDHREGGENLARGMRDGSAAEDVVERMGVRFEDDEEEDDEEDEQEVVGADDNDADDDDEDHDGEEDDVDEDDDGGGGV